MKHDSASLLIEGIREVLAGKVWFDQPLLQEAMGRVGSQESKAERFTERERQVLSYVFEGLVIIIRKLRNESACPRVR
jgi:DNA-binding NarL/FixJ family response regulator